MGESRLRQLSLDDLVALNDEIRSLTRGGCTTGRRTPRACRRSSWSTWPTGNIAQQPVGGWSIVDRRVRSSRSDSSRLPRSARRWNQVRPAPSSAARCLDGSAAGCRVSSSYRGVYGLSPSGSSPVASCLFAFSMTRTLPANLGTFQGIGFEQPRLLDVQISVAEWLLGALPWIWLVLLLAIVIWWFRSRSSKAIYTGGLGWLPAMSRLIREGRLATFAEVLALLVEQRVPLHEAIDLAADAAGDRRLRAAGQAFAERIRRGEARAVPSGFPPLLGWLLLSGGRPERLAAALHKSAARHRDRAAFLGRWVAGYVPIMLVAAFGGAVTLLYALLVLGPLYRFLYQLS